jgi:RNA-binding protein
MQTMCKNNISKKYLRSLGHKLKPIVFISKNGLSENIKTEIVDAIERHELIKIKIASNCRVEKSRLSKQICEENNAKLIQEIGNIILIFKSSHNPNPKLSNLLRMRDRT